ncbi:TetR/AcrR family transcriptional regulator [Pararhizobium sp. YC-54]|uniref:TetR/AcrR family transcriptional regulator n=1 Tax=Pararhizobium sp. YC-54 TaxID=2986920 RepID=UPI0021F7C6A6|nr:TetR/AcrR family transcriptional regulator [Pararhizobium sp. YC-54]MCW0001232.1 TetR/AcrR family transcriptional regulator [Pararhizobium sp. YC-54]
MRRSNSERTETMRAALIAAARRLFVEKGYADTSTPDIVAAAGVTRGALYHHFEDKKALFAAVVAEEARKVSEEIESASAGSATARDGILDGTRAYFDALTVPGRIRLLLLDGPSVLGADTMQRLNEAHSEASLKQGLRELFAASGKAPDLLDAFAGLLGAAFDRAALAIAAGASRKEYEAAITALIDGISVR